MNMPILMKWQRSSNGTQDAGLIFFHILLVYLRLDMAPLHLGKTLH